MSIDSTHEDMTMNGYANDNLESVLGIKFVDVPDERFDKMKRKLQIVADQLDRALPKIMPPAKGVLNAKLSANQRNILNAVLWPQYAKRHAEHMANLTSIPIQDTDEPMVDIKDVIAKRDVSFTYSTLPFHEACGNWAGKDRVMYVRQEIAHKAASVFRALNHREVRYKPHLEDCWRPPEVQKGLYIRRVIRIARENPSWDMEQVKMHASSLTAPAPGFAGHQAGAAIDWQLRRTGDENFLDSGNYYAEGGACSCLDFPYLTFNQFRTRVFFLLTAHMGAFKVLSTENWHMSSGDRGMVRGEIKMATAKYGPIRSFNKQTGRTESYEAGDIDVPFLIDDQIQELVDLAGALQIGGKSKPDYKDIVRRFFNAGVAK
ncbi:hypothetical protein KJ652_01820 [Patescibacteria group bacterium]|nr:hypothetical protein [Patescibacteria group bacterium]